jgi:hypothetical protein
MHLLSAATAAQIELIDGKWHNLPSFPNIIRSFNAFVLGTFMSFTGEFADK